MILPSLTIAPAGQKGRGVFATKNIAKGTVIEISPVIVLSVKDRAIIEQSVLTNYIFEWGNSKRKAILALGYISMYNHSYDANCEYEMDYDEDIMTITTVKPVKKGEELCINYNGVPDKKDEVWFHHLIKDVQ
ncbi:MAG: SET domain-containing protein [Arachidicoccus sp.]|nr:SET domain-containing protein [Arachidicoccus sp.]